jgi:hypothetical protein
VNTHVTAVVLVCRSRWMMGSAGATSDWSSAYEMPASASTPKVSP